MNYIRMSGGLGNQMFQYSFAKAYLLKHKFPIILDISFYQDWAKKQNITPRNYKINQFHITLEETMSPPFWAKFFQSRYLKKIHDSIYSPLIIEDEEQGYNSEYINTKYSNRLFIGYFQSPRYFEQYRDVLLKDFTKKEEVSGNYKSLQKRINESHSVSIHIRRGDYLLAQNSSIHGVIGIDYYLQAIKYIQSKVINPKFFIFSDDIDWCKLNLKIADQHEFIDPIELSSDIDDLISMSLCKHNIIANSSFSWWGAWLNQNPEKIVIAPINWFVDKTRLSKWEIYPKEWILL